MGYYLVLRRNGSACGCLGPYASASVARAEATALPRMNPQGAECVVVRANGFRDAISAALEAYRGVGKAAREARSATVEAARVGVEEAKAAPGRAVKAAERKVKAKVKAIERAGRKRAYDKDQFAKRAVVNDCIRTIEEAGFTVTLSPYLYPSKRITAGTHLKNPAGVEPLPARLPRSTEIQTLLFDAKAFNVGQAKSWAKRHGFRFGKVDTGGGRATMIRLRQHDPADYTAGSFRTIPITDGVQAVIGMPTRSAKRNPEASRLAAAAIAPELVAAHAAAGLAVRGVKAAGRSVSGIASDAGTAFADIVAPRSRRR